MSQEPISDNDSDTDTDDDGGSDGTDGAGRPRPAFTPYPAIDVRDGTVVRLRQGDYEQETRYTDDPVAVARRYAASGAEWLHLVDLDAARSGETGHAAALVAQVADLGLKVQAGGGVRSMADVQRLRDAGAERVVVGSMAVIEPEEVIGWLGEVGPDHLTVAVDTRADEAGQWVLPVSGWTEVSATDLVSTLHQYVGEGLRHLLCTDINRDGTFGGPNLHLYTMLRHTAPDLLIQASGGVRDLNDVRAVRRLGCAGVIVGKALLDGRIHPDDLAEQRREAR